MSKSAKIMARFIMITSLLSPGANASLRSSFREPNLMGEKTMRVRSRRLRGVVTFAEIGDRGVDDLVAIDGTNALRSTDTDAVPLKLREWCDRPRLRPSVASWRPCRRCRRHIAVPLKDPARVPPLETVQRSRPVLPHLLHTAS